MKTITMAGLIMAAACLLGFGCASEQENKLAAEAKVSRADAERTALTRVPGGTIKEGEIEKEKGRLIWSFDIAGATQNITEVQVDALTGEIVSVEKETASDEAKEKKKDQEQKR